MIDLVWQKPSRLRIVVRDTGPGVPAGMQMRIFEEFAQADAAHVFGGAGLGLAIVRKLARNLGGDVGVESTPPRGASFWVEIPAAALAPAAPQSHDLAGRSILIAAPTEFLRQSLTQAIEAAGAVVIQDDPQNANVDAILLDHAVAQHKLSQFTGLGAPIVVLAPQEERALIAEYREAGIVNYVLKPVRRAALVARLRAAIQGEPLAAPKRDGGKVSVLVADDNAVNALIARTWLERAGCAVSVVGDGAAALDAVRQGQFDLVFLDLRMPVLGGIAAARGIRALPGAVSATPLIALTADAGESERAEAMAAGMNDFVTKPISPQQLADALARFTGQTNEAKLAAS
jgi:CheY-like chemotaxis protein